MKDLNVAPDTRPSSRLLLPVLAAHGIFLFFWLPVLQNGPLLNDWYALWDVGSRFVSGEWKDLYAPIVPETGGTYFWRYPPFALYLTALVGWMPRNAAYFAFAGLGLVALGAAVRIVSRGRHDFPDYGVWLTGIVCSAPFFNTVATGQNSALIVLLIFSCWAFWEKGRVLASCALMGLFAIKPNWGIFFGLFALARGEFRGAFVQLLVVAALVLSTIPLGTDVWADFLAMAGQSEAIAGTYSTHLQAMLKGFLEGAFGATAFAKGLWFSIAPFALGAAIFIWRSTRTNLDKFGALVLLSFACNPYISSYDAFVLMVPITAWWLRPAAHRGQMYSVIGWVYLIAWLFEHVVHGWPVLLNTHWRPPFSLAGPAATAVLFLEAFDAFRDRLRR